MEKSKNKYLQYSHPTYWFQISSELFHSVEVLYENRKKSITGETDDNNVNQILKPTVSRAFFLLAGYTIENLLKALLIIENPDLVETGKIDKSISTGHNIRVLAKKINNVSFDSDELKLFDLFSEALPYWGRYPIPKKWQQLEKEKIMTDEMYEIFSKLYHKLRKEIYLNTRLGWIGPDGTEQGEWYDSEYDSDLSFEEFKLNENNYKQFRRQNIARKGMQ